MTIKGHTLDALDVPLVREFSGDTTRYESAYDSDVLIVLDLKEDPALEREGLMRTVVNRVQRLRKAAGLAATDSNIVVYYTLPDSSEGKAVVVAINEHLQKIETETHTKLVSGTAPAAEHVLDSSSSEVNDAKFDLQLVRKS